jgi:endonuclease III
VAQREMAKQAYEESKKTPIVREKSNIAASASESAGPVGSASEIRNARKKDHINRFKERDRIKRDQRNKRVKRRNKTSNSESSSSDDNSSKDELIITKKNEQLLSSSDSSSHYSEESYSGSNWEHSGDSDSESIFVYEKEEEEESVSESDLIKSEKKQSVKKSLKSDLKITKKRKFQESSESSTTRKKSSTSVPSTPKKHMKKNRKPPTPTQIQRERDIAVFSKKPQQWITEQTKKLNDFLMLIDLLKQEHNYSPPRMMWSNVIPVEKGSDMYPYYMLVMLTTTPATNDKSVITTFEMLFKKTGDDLTPQGMLDFDKKHLLRYLSPMGRQNINMEMLMEQALQLIEQHDGKVPIDYEALIKLPGVGPKIANILLYDAFDMVHVSIL